jgi:hypothetical protein
VARVVPHLRRQPPGSEAAGQDCPRQTRAKHARRPPNALTTTLNRLTQDCPDQVSTLRRASFLETRHRRRDIEFRLVKVGPHSHRFRQRVVARDVRSARRWCGHRSSAPWSWVSFSSLSARAMLSKDSRPYARSARQDDL